MIYSGVSFPIFNTGSARYEVLRGTVVVLTHECDVEQANQKPFNSDLIFAPIGRFDDFFTELRETKGEDEAKAYLGDLCRDRISQLFYFPPFGEMATGGIVYLNRIGTSHLSQFQRDGVAAVSALSAYGYQRLGWSLANHL